MTTMEISHGGEVSRLEVQHQNESRITGENETAGSDEEHESHKPQRSTVVVSSWVRIALNGGEPAEVLKKHYFPQIGLNLRNAIADSLGVCRSSVSIVDMHAVNVDVLVNPLPLLKPREHERHTSFAHRVTQFMRSMTARNRTRYLQHMKVTQVKSVYEVRVFDKMQLSEFQVARHIDGLQLYSKFSELNRQLTHVFALEGPRIFETVMLDDVGYASRRTVMRPPLSKGHVADCMEEELLRNARRTHQLVVATCLLLVAMTTCVGSLIFTIKQPSSIPSRLNPLLGRSVHG